MPRPFILDPLFRAITALPGIGPKNAKLLEKLIGGPKIADLLWHAPADFIDRRFSPQIADAPEGRVATIEVDILQHNPAPRRGAPYRITASDKSGTMTLTFFHTNQGWMNKLLPVNEKRVVSGRIEMYQGRPQMVHPEVVELENRAELERVEAIYPLTQGIGNKVLGKAVTAALEDLPVLPEWLDPALVKREEWPDWSTAVNALHNPLSPLDCLPACKTRQRLAYDELLAHQLTLAIVRQTMKKKGGREMRGGGHLRDKLSAALPFCLTGAQQLALSEIGADMAAPYKMLRLLQGDVGSGKTIVAAMAMLQATESGAQAAMLAPTEILARQHAETLAPLLEPLGIKTVILTGRDKGKERANILRQIESGEARIILGTHAIFQESVNFHDLGLAVIDEQHRFGVHQRLALSDKGKGADVLVMTATPIPRTLTLTAYGDMDVSRLDEKPPGRKPIETKLVSRDRVDDMIAGVKRQIQSGARIYWVCPLVEDSEAIKLTSAEERYDVLKSVFGDRTGLVHGRMKPAEKDEVMQKFAAGALDILVATTVIEVGVNVPEATVMIIEHAERFGLAQLHQLRGRVGRGGDQSYCFLLYGTPLGEIAKKRLSIMRETEDGFVIAEKDLELRGAGDILGVKQSGMPRFRLADLEAHKSLIQTASDDARLILDKGLLAENNPDLSDEQRARGQALRTLLYLFERDQAIGYLQSG